MQVLAGLARPAPSAQAWILESRPLGLNQLVLQVGLVRRCFLSSLWLDL